MVGFRPRASTRTGSRSCGASSRRRATTETTCWRRPGCYLDEVARLRDRAHAFANVTGGGVLGNLSRVLPESLVAEIDWNGWERPPVFGWLARHVAEDELRRVFNLGIGYVAVLPDPGDELVIGRIARA